MLIFDLLFLSFPGTGGPSFANNGGNGGGAVKNSGFALDLEPAYSIF